MIILDELNKAHGMTIVLVTHETDIATYANREIIIKDGRVLLDRNTRADLQQLSSEV